MYVSLCANKNPSYFYIENFVTNTVMKQDLFNNSGNLMVYNRYIVVRFGVLNSEGRGELFVYY